MSEENNNINMSIENVEQPTNDNNESKDNEKTVLESTPVIPEKVELNLNLLMAIHTLLETSINRGAFKAPEIREVGEIYEHYTKAINYLKYLSDQNNKN